jgi:hypothetical protein
LEIIGQSTAEVRKPWIINWQLCLC